MKNLFLVLLSFITISIQAQSLENIVKEWLEDAPNGFHNAFAKYGRTGNGYFNDIDFMLSDGQGGYVNYEVGFELKPQGSLEDTYDKYEGAMFDNWALVKGWNGFPIMSKKGLGFEKSGDDGIKQIYISLGKNRDGSKAEIVTIGIAWMDIKGDKLSVPNKNSVPIANKITSVTQKPTNISGCISGDCNNGFGTKKYTKNGKTYRYEGYFKNGQFHGLGMEFNEWLNKNVPQVMGHYENGTLKISQEYYAIEPPTGLQMEAKSYMRTEEEYIKLADKTQAIAYKVRYISKAGKKENPIKYMLHYSPSGSKIIINRPIAKAFGTCISGDCNNGKGTLRLTGIGDFKGKFQNGIASSCLLTLNTGEVIGVSIKNGIPINFKAFKLPAGVSRVEMAKRRVFKLGKNDCLEGDCMNGTGVGLVGHADRLMEAKLSKDAEELQGYFKGTFKSTTRQQGTLYTFKGRQLTGDFSKGGNGTFTSVKDGKKETYYLKNGKRVTADGQPYSEYLAAVKEKERNATSSRTNTSSSSKRTKSRSGRDASGTLLAQKMVNGSDFELPNYSAYNDVVVYVSDFGSKKGNGKIRLEYGTYEKNGYALNASSVYGTLTKGMGNVKIPNGAFYNKLILDLPYSSNFEIIVRGTKRKTVQPAKKEITAAQHKAYSRKSAEWYKGVMEAEGFTVLKTLYFAADEVPAQLDLNLHSGNTYNYGVMASDSKTKVNFTVGMYKYKKVDGKSVKDGLGQVLNGNSQGNAAELDVVTNKLRGQRATQFSLTKTGNNPKTYIAVVISYKSKDNTTNQKSNNKAEDYYTKQYNAEMDKLLEENLEAIKENNRKLEELIKELEKNDSGN